MSIIPWIPTRMSNIADRPSWLMVFYQSLPSNVVMTAFTAISRFDFIRTCQLFAPYDFFPAFCRLLILTK